MKRLLLVALAALVVLAAVLLVRAARFTPRTADPPAAVPFVPVAGAADRLAGAIRIPTVSHGDSTLRDSAAFRQMHAYLAASFPRAHATLVREVVGRDALLYTWRGTDSALAPIVLMGHMDVVPVEPGTDTLWTHPPFSGAIAEGFIWGRGALDDKGTVLGLLEATEALLAQSFVPKRTIYLAFGADEELGGEQGARRVAELLRSRGVKPAMVLDEGGTVVTGAVPGVAKPIAVVGIAEKGYVSVELVVRAAGGHSSMPPRQTAAGILAAALARLEASPFPGGIRGATADFFEVVGREMPLERRVLLANRWLFDPVLERVLARSPGMNAALRTTTAITMLEGSPKDNVLPSTARAVVNFRILPGESVESVVRHVRRVVDDERVQARVHGTTAEPSPVSPTGDSTWARLAQTIRQAYPDAIVAPYLVLGATDARHFRDLTPNVYRFAAGRMDVSDLPRAHGTNERVGVAPYLEAIGFLALLIRNVAG